MKIKFKNQKLEIVYLSKSRTQKYPLQPDVLINFVEAIEDLENATDLSQIKNRRGFNFEKYRDYYSIRISRKYRLEFDIEYADEFQTTVDSIVILELSNHYGD